MTRTMSTVRKVIVAVIVSGGLAVLTVFASSAAAGEKKTPGGEPITNENWQQNAQIKAVDTIVRSVNTGMSSGSLALSKRLFEYCQPYGIVERVIARDASGRARMYEERGGSDNSDRRIRRYYADTGQLRFVVMTDKARGGGELVQKVYFDETGRRLWVDRKVTGAPENAFPATYSDNVLVVDDPGKAFAAPSPCKEISSQAMR